MHRHYRDVPSRGTWWGRGLNQGRRILNTTDRFLMKHGRLIGDIATAAAPVAGILGPEAAVGVAAAGKFASTYSAMRADAAGGGK